MRRPCSKLLTACPGAHRCLGNTRARQFGPGPSGVLANLTELIVHEVEAAAGRALQRRQSERLLSVMDLYQAPHMLVDTGAHRWRILHLNARAVEVAGAARIRPHCLASAVFSIRARSSRVTEDIHKRLRAASNVHLVFKPTKMHEDRLWLHAQLQCISS